MHRGHLYPYLFERWQAECFFFPGFVPRKLYVSCPVGFGSSWDRLSVGVVTQTGAPDALSTGDPLWLYVFPGGTADLSVLFHRVAVFPKEYSVIVRIAEHGPMVASLITGSVMSPQRSFAGWQLSYASNFPPYSLGVVPPIVIRPASWSEV
jgi:hypothetical protein